MSQTTVTRDEVRRRTILHSDWVPCKAAFIDCRTPGSDQKDNYSFIGSGVSQSSQQFVNLTEPHGFSLGAAGMPRGTTNSLHLHFTAEVFINFGGEYRLRWGADGRQGEYVSTDGDVISVPTWVFRGFTNEGPDDGILLTVLGRDDTGGIIWGPTVLQEAEGYGLRLTADNRLIDTAAGDEVPTDVDLISPMPQEEIDRLDRFTVEQFRTRVVDSVGPPMGETSIPVLGVCQAETPSWLRSSGTAWRRTAGWRPRCTSRTTSTSPGCAPPRARGCCVTGTRRRRSSRQVRALGRPPERGR